MRPRTGDETLADATRACYDLEEAGRQGLEDLHEFEGGEAGLLMRLDNDGVAGRQRSGGFPAQQHQREVERQYDDDGAQRFLDAEMELARHGRTGDAPGLVPCEFRIIVDGGGAPRDLVNGFLERLAFLARHAFGIEGLVAPDGGGDVVKDDSAAARILLAPDLAGAVGNVDRLIDFGVGRVRDAPQTVLGCRFDHIELLRAAARNPVAVDVKLARQACKIIKRSHAFPLSRSRLRRSPAAFYMFNIF